MSAAPKITYDLPHNRELFRDPANAPHSLSMLLAAGGDGRIQPDPATGRNRYGTKTTPSIGEISFASTTASNVSVQGFAAADEQLKRLFGVDGSHAVAIDQWFANIHHRIGDSLGCAGSDIVLAASGTDVELLALGLTLALSKRPVTNILIAPEETGSGIPRAAAGRHFADATALGYRVAAGEVLDGMSADRIEVRTVAIRNDAGQARSADEIDGEVIMLAEQALKHDRDVLLHVLDTSKTGLTAVSRATARHVAALAPGRVRVLVDACQFRCGIADLRRDIADGFLVAVTGSKFLAGPPFAGALALPPAVVDELSATLPIAAGLSQYTALHDWSSLIHGRTSLEFGSHFNLGLGLRWIAALEQLDPLAGTGADLQRQIKQAFANLVRERAHHLQDAMIHADDEGDHIVDRAIVPLTITNGAGAFASLAQTQALHLALREHGAGPVCHVGQAVHLSARTILRIAASAADVNAVSARLAEGYDMARAMQPIADDLDILFGKWAVVSQTVRGM
ncbi:hypothetical protein [Rhizobium sp. 2MFCol3.1]|uniref:hypothetical protein n=1 Tax=Rhizobium sp. 2MFCol3.1 TaxID=1246459 RepID=UPI0003640200|nr:hypothetical protein [Rhizobium sp. 2MFCol3.1]